MIKELGYLGGMNSQATLQGVPDGQMVTLKNINYFGRSIVTSGGAFKVGTGGTTASGALFYYIDPSAKEWFLRVDFVGGKVYAGRNVTTAVSFTDITDPINPTFGVTGFAILNGTLFVGTVGGLFSWAGAGTLALVAGAPVIEISAICTVNNFLFIAERATSNFYWSNVNDGTTWAPANELQFRNGDGDFITALDSIGSTLIIFKNSSTGTLSTSTIILSGIVTLGPLLEVSSKLGCIGSFSHDKMPDGSIVLMGSDSHVYLFDGATFSDISVRPYPYGSIQNAMIGVYVGVGSSSSCSVAVFPTKNEIWVAATPSTNFSWVYVYDYVNKSWYQKDSGGIASFYYYAKSNINTGFGLVNGGNTGVTYVSSALLSADSTGGMYIENSPASNSKAGVAPSYIFEFSFLLPPDLRTNTPLFFVLPVQCIQGSPNTISYFTGRNGTYGSATVYTPTGSGAIDRLQVRLPSTLSYSSQQVKLTLSSTKTYYLDVPYLSDEMDI